MNNGHMLIDQAFSRLLVAQFASVRHRFDLTLMRRLVSREPTRRDGLSSFQLYRSY